MERTMRGLKFNVELKAPTNPLNIPKYIEKIKNLFLYTNKVSIASKQSASISGFDQNYNLAKSLLTYEPSLDILFHLTCSDVNKVNIHARLTLLRLLDIKRILVVTGDDYTRPYEGNQTAELYFTDSNELLEHIININHSTKQFRSIGVAGYPNGNGIESNNNQEECDRLRRKLELGSNAIYTQCIFDPKVFKEFNRAIRERYPHWPIDITPSIAVFQKHSNLQTISKLTRVSLDERLVIRFSQLTEIEQSRGQAKKYLMELCRTLIDESDGSPLTIDLCTFGQFELTTEIMRDLLATDTDGPDSKSVTSNGLCLSQLMVN